MKKKIIAGMIICVLAILSLYKVGAYSGEVDPEGYITLPYIINVANNKGTGTVSVSATGYEISYQKVDVSETLYNSMTSKRGEIDTHYETINEQKKEKETNLSELRKAHSDLVESGTATEAQIKEAKDKYDEAYSEYSTFINNANARLKELQDEFNELIPNYNNNSWKKTTNGSNNIELDFSGKSGKIHFTLWVKIENGTNTYYDFKVYSSEIRNDEPSVPQNGKWTDFTKSKISVKNDLDIRKYFFTISNVIPMDEHLYYYAIGDGSTTPEFSTDLEQLSYDATNKVLKSKNISEYLELGPNQYIYIYEYYLDKDENKFVQKLVVDKSKLEKPVQKKYTDVFCGTMITDSDTQILFNTPWGNSTVRKVHLKIGKISDDAILKNIYDKKSNAFEELLKYAKKANVFYDKTLDSNSDGSAGGIVLNESDSLFAANNITDGEYYFLYAVVEDENGKYVKTEGVTFARASKLQTNSYSLFFYGSDDFSWKTFSNGEQGNNNGEDDTKAPGVIPQAGISNIILIVSGVTAITGIIMYKKYKKYNY